MAEIRRVSPGEMIATANNIRQKIEQWDGCVQELYRLQAELDAMFDGLTNDEYNRQWEEDKAKYNLLSQTLTEYCAAIVTAANRYSERDAEIKSMIQS